MALTLHLGVIEVPYSEPPPTVSPAPRFTKSGRLHKGSAKRLARQYRGGPTRQVETTGEVAEVLEERYHVMETFFDRHADEIGEDFADSMRGELEGLFMGAPASSNPYATAESKLQQRFKQAIDMKEFDGLPGVPTKASLHGINHRLRHPYAKRAARPSFLDTGLYRQSFIAWID